MGMSSSASFNGMGIGEMRMPVDVNRLSKALTIVTSPSMKSGMGHVVPDSPGGKKVNRGARLCEAATSSEGQGGQGYGHGHGQLF